MEQLLEYEELFPEPPMTLEQYLQGGDKNIILNTAAFFLGFKSHQSKFKDNRELLQAIFGPENNAFANEVYNKIKYREDQGTAIKIINPYTSLKLFEYFFSKPEEPVTQTSAEFEKNLFKAYLLLNSVFTKAQETAFLSTNRLDDDLKIPMMMFCMHYPVSDKTNYDLSVIWSTQVLKAIYLFQYLENNEKTKFLLTAFLAHFVQPSWEEYLKSLLPLTMSTLKNKKEAHTDIVVEKGDKFEEGCVFIEKLIVTEKDEIDQNDFLTTRAKPFYKIKDLFLVEKIFKGAYFLLRDINNTLALDRKVAGLKGIYGHEFSEQILLYRTLKTIYTGKMIRFSGKELADNHIDGAPDYYIRKGKNVLLFESKDFLIRADLKASFDYNIYEEEFSKTLYYEIRPNGQEKAGAVMQLISTIRKLLKNQFKPDISYHYKDIFIFPILITHDHQYDTPGLQDLVNSWFSDELTILEEEGLFINRVKPLTIINIDSLIFHQIALNESIQLHEVINAYHEYIKLNRTIKFKSDVEKKQYRMDKLVPFSFFIDKYLDKLDLWRIPPIMNTVAPALFKDAEMKL